MTFEDPPWGIYAGFVLKDLKPNTFDPFEVATLFLSKKCG
jgi:hypothetical protein